MAEPTPPRTYVLSGHRTDTDVPGRLVEFVMSLTYDMPHVTPEDIGVIAYRLQHSALAPKPDADLALGDHHVGVGR